MSGQRLNGPKLERHSGQPKDLLSLTVETTLLNIRHMRAVAATSFRYFHARRSV